jgi:hypothetical protein
VFALVLIVRRSTAGVVKLNSEPVTGTSYVDHTVQPGQTYYYVIKAVSAKGSERPRTRSKLTSLRSRFIGRAAPDKLWPLTGLPFRREEAPVMDRGLERADAGARLSPP